MSACDASVDDKVCFVVLGDHLGPRVVAGIEPASAWAKGAPSFSHGLCPVTFVARSQTRRVSVLQVTGELGCGLGREGTGPGSPNTCEAP